MGSEIGKPVSESRFLKKNAGGLENLRLFLGFLSQRGCQARLAVMVFKKEKAMTPRMTDHFKRAAPGYKALLGFEMALKESPLEHTLLHLIKLRASQINGCAFCLQMHAAEALKDGETQLRLHLLAGWRDSTLYSAREQAALGWTEALTLVAQTHAPEADWQAVSAEFNADELAWLSYAIGMINLWNRVQVGFRAPHGMDMPKER